jgi:murein DD-endopeptidase MepM/ murein hydrolase activator NlpD
MICAQLIVAFLLVFVLAPAQATAGTLGWPIGCVPGINCQRDSTFRVGYPDIDGAGRAFDCTPPGYTGHTGTDITASSVDDGVAVFAADDGEVLWVSGGKYDRCPNDDEPDCNPELQPVISGLSRQSPNCNDFGPACGAANCCLSWGFNAGNFVLIKHANSPESAITFYAHLRKGSIIVANGQRVRKGDKIAEVGSSGASLTPHLHFGVWKKLNDHFELTDPWAGKCGPNFSASLWEYNPPYKADIAIAKNGTGSGVVSSLGGELSCGSSCAGIVTPGTRITLRAIPYSGSEFAGWGGGCVGEGNTCTIVADGKINVTALFRDTTPPTVRSLDIPPYSTGLTVPVNGFTAADNVRVAGYLLTETPAPPSPKTASWSSSQPSSYTCSSPGNKTLYAWVKDMAGNVSPPLRANIRCGAQESAKSSPLPAQPVLPPSATSNRFPSDGT